jgi:hypothetical protein
MNDMTFSEELTHYDTACKAVAAANSVDEIKDIREKAEAMRTYARQAKNKQLEIDASEIRFRAERRLGELMEAQRQIVGLAPAGRPKEIGSEPDPIIKPLTLAEAGIDVQTCRDYFPLSRRCSRGMLTSHLPPCLMPAPSRAHRAMLSREYPKRAEAA